MLGGPYGAHVLVAFRGKPVFVAAGGSLGPQQRGYTLVADEAVAGDVYAAFAAKVGGVAGAGAAPQRRTARSG